MKILSKLGYRLFSSYNATICSFLFKSNCYAYFGSIVVVSSIMLLFNYFSLAYESFT